MRAEDAGQQPAPALVVEQRPTPFDQGRIRLSLSAGGGSYGGNGFFSIGAGVGYFIFKGFELGGEVVQWIGSDPNITQLSPSLRYIFHQVPVVHPYLGAFYRHWFTWDGFPDQDTVGARAGIYLTRLASVGVIVGVGYEAVVSSCSANCHAVYPEIGVMLTF